MIYGNKIAIGNCHNTTITRILELIPELFWELKLIPNSHTGTTSNALVDDHENKVVDAEITREPSSEQQQKGREEDNNVRELPAAGGGGGRKKKTPKNFHRFHEECARNYFAHSARVLEKPLLANSTGPGGGGDDRDAASAPQKQ